MSIQTEAMRDTAGPDQYVTVGQHKETKLWHGILMINHPTPSGCERWMMAYSDQRGWPDEKTAKAEFKAALKFHDAGKQARIMKKATNSKKPTEKQVQAKILQILKGLRREDAIRVLRAAAILSGVEPV